MLEDAGFVVQTLEVRSFTTVFGDIGQIIDFFAGDDVRAVCSRSQRCDYAGFRQAMETLLAGEYARCVSNEGIRLERYVLLAVAEKPY
jgi:hypothetical protein